MQSNERKAHVSLCSATDDVYEVFEDRPLARELDGFPLCSPPVIELPTIVNSIFFLQAASRRPNETEHEGEFGCLWVFRIKSFQLKAIALTFLHVVTA